MSRINSRLQETKPLLRQIFDDATTGMSDLYCYFYARALQVLRPGGIHVFICSNTWLDVGFGAKLQEYLLKNACIRTIYESQVEKEFSTAEINTLISVISKDVAQPTTVTRFITLRDRFAVAIADKTKARVVSVTHGDLWESGIDNEGASPRYVGEKWGGRYLRAPDIYHEVFAKGKLVPVSRYARARLGVTTGANEFFFLEKNGQGSYYTYVTGEKLAISFPDKYLRPVIRSVSDCESITFTSGDTPWQIVTLPVDIRDRSARAYVELAEKSGISSRPFFRGKRVWYSLTTLPDDLIAVPEIVYTRYFFLWNQEQNVLNKNFYGYQAHSAPVPLLWSILNSTFTFLQFELSSRKPGAGASGIGVGVANRTAVIALESLGVEEKDVLIEAGKSLLKRPILNYDQDIVSPARRALDEILFSHMGLSRTEGDAVYESYCELISARVAKSQG